ncbi:hypothetical protein QZM92_13450, partial [Burkholderia multivorans]|nr:hypothetical protein [Burkholderia multivorans]
REVRPEYERNSPRMSSNSYVNLKIATCLVRYADDRLIDQRFLNASFVTRTHTTSLAALTAASRVVASLQYNS